MPTYPYKIPADRNTHACNCIGPQYGQPVCPCRMRNVTIENGRYVERHDLGPVQGSTTDRTEWPFDFEQQRER